MGKFIDKKNIPDPHNLELFFLVNGSERRSGGTTDSDATVKQKGDKFLSLSKNGCKIFVVEVSSVLPGPDQLSPPHRFEGLRVLLRAIQMAWPSAGSIDKHDARVTVCCFSPRRACSIQRVETWRGSKQTAWD